MRLAALLLAALALACAPGGTKVEHEEGMDLARLRRLGVATFTDPRGHGKSIALQVFQGLAKLGFEPVAPERIDRALAGLKRDEAGGWSMMSLLEVRRVTGAEALVFGALDPAWHEAKVIVMETELGDSVLSATVRPRKGGAFRDADEVVAETLRVFGAQPASR